MRANSPNRLYDERERKFRLWRTVVEKARTLDTARTFSHHKLAMGMDAMPAAEFKDALHQAGDPWRSGENDYAEGLGGLRPDDLVPILKALGAPEADIKKVEFSNWHGAWAMLVDLAREYRKNNPRRGAR